LHALGDPLSQVLLLLNHPLSSPPASEGGFHEDRVGDSVGGDCCLGFLEVFDVSRRAHGHRDSVLDGELPGEGLVPEEVDVGAVGADELDVVLLGGRLVATHTRPHDTRPHHTVSIGTTLPLRQSARQGHALLRVIPSALRGGGSSHKGGVLCHETIARVTAVGPTLLGDTDNVLDVEVRGDSVGLLPGRGLHFIGLVGALSRVKWESVGGSSCGVP